MIWYTIKIGIPYIVCGEKNTSPTIDHIEEKIILEDRWGLAFVFQSDSMTQRKEIRRTWRHLRLCSELMLDPSDLPHPQGRGGEK
jgi:hypothetical protein